MPRYGKVLTAVICLSAVGGCTQDGEAAAKAGDIAKLPPEVFSHGDPVAVSDQPCLSSAGVLITAVSIGPVAVGTPLKQLRLRCPIALIKVPQSVAIQGPVFGVSVTGGLIAFIVVGKDSVIETVGSSSPAFRTSNGIGVGTPARGLSFRKGRVCFVHDATQITRVIVSRRELTC
jgi:hypothetical protein